MKKMLIMVLAVFLSFGFVTAVMSQDEPQNVFERKMAMSRAMTFEGTVLSHDVSCHCVVVGTSAGNLTFQDDYAKFDQDYNRLKGLKVGAMIRGEYKTVDHINYAVWVGLKK
jgi:hypothetical protein